VSKVLTLADTIVTTVVPDDPRSEMACGMKARPFHQWAHIASPSLIPTESICNLPGEGGNVLTCYPHNGPRVTYRVKGDKHEHSSNPRVSKCLAVKPLSPEAKKALGL
jgi:hypothetical protein